MEWFILVSLCLGLTALGFLAGAITGVIFRNTWQERFDSLHKKFDEKLAVIEKK